MFGAENGQFPGPTGEIKRLRCENLERPESRVLRHFEFGGVF